MCLKVSVSYGQKVGFFVSFLVNLEGYQYCMISSKVTHILPHFLFKIFKRRHVEYLDAIYWNIAGEAGEALVCVLLVVSLCFNI